MEESEAWVSFCELKVIHETSRRYTIRDYADIIIPLYTISILSLWVLE